MTDEEVICAWMEPNPTKHWLGVVAEQGRMPEWWAMQDGLVCTWRPRTLDLVALWKVQDRLDDEQWYRYGVGLAAELNMSRTVIISFREFIQFVHATPEQKIKALAAVLRPLVEAPK